MSFYIIFVACCDCEVSQLTSGRSAPLPPSTTTRIIVSQIQNEKQKIPLDSYSIFKYNYNIGFRTKSSNDLMVLLRLSPDGDGSDQFRKSISPERFFSNKINRLKRSKAEQSPNNQLPKHFPTIRQSFSNQFRQQIFKIMFRQQIFNIIFEYNR